MYYKTDPTVVEADDIVSIEHMEIQQQEDGSPPRLIVTFVLDPFAPKTFDPQKMHLTNGVTHRLLIPDKTKITEKKSKSPKDDQKKHDLDIYQGNASQYDPAHQEHNPQNGYTVDDRIDSETKSEEKGDEKQKKNEDMFGFSKEEVQGTPPPAFERKGSEDQHDDISDEKDDTKSGKKRSGKKETKDTSAPDDSGSQHQGSQPIRSTKPEEETYGTVFSSDNQP